MKRICLQAGHQNARNNCDPKLQGSTGAPGEMEFNVRVRDRVSQILLSKKNPDGSDAFTLQLVDATFNCDPQAPKQNYHLFLSIHYDADVYGKGGGFIDFPEPSTDGATAESQRIAKAIASEYFKHSGIEEVNRSNKNTRYFYMWKFLSSATPCVIIECGVGQNAHDKVLLNDTERIANAIARGICAAFGVSFDPLPAPTPTPTPPNENKAEIEALQRLVQSNRDELFAMITKLFEETETIRAKLAKMKDAL